MFLNHLTSLSVTLQIYKHIIFQIKWQVPNLRTRTVSACVHTWLLSRSKFEFWVWNRQLRYGSGRRRGWRAAWWSSTFISLHFSLQKALLSHPRAPALFSVQGREHLSKQNVACSGKLGILWPLDNILSWLKKSALFFGNSSGSDHCTLRFFQSEAGVFKNFYFYRL